MPGVQTRPHSEANVAEGNSAGVAERRGDLVSQGPGVRTDPLLLPPLSPKISDSQRAKVFAAEEHVESALSLPPASIGDIEVISDILEIEPAVTNDGKQTGYWRGGRVEFGQQTTLPGYLHEAAHHLTPEIFPPHGIEWVANFYKLLGKYTDWHDDYVRSFTEHKVRQTVEAALKRARKDAIYFANKERGCLARVVVDEPPQSFVCQLLDVEPDFVRLADDSGEFAVDVDRLRYVSATLST